MCGGRTEVGGWSTGKFPSEVSIDSSTTGGCVATVVRHTSPTPRMVRMGSVNKVTGECAVTPVRVNTTMPV